MILPPKKDDSCVLWLDFASVKNNTVYDQSKYHNDGKVYGAQHIGRFGLHGLSFDGVDDYVRVPPFLQDGDSFSIILFSRFGSVDDWRTMTAFYYAGNGMSYQGDSNPQIWFAAVTDYNNETNYIIKSPFVKTQTNYFTAMSVDNVNKKMIAFLNDIKLDEITLQGSTIRLTNRDLNIYRIEAQDDFLSGDVYFLAVYNRALSDVEIRELYYYLTKGIRSIIPSRFVARKVG